MNRSTIFALALLVPVPAAAQQPPVTYRPLATTDTGLWVSFALASPDGRFVLVNGTQVLNVATGARTSLRPKRPWGWGVWSRLGDLITFAKPAEDGSGSQIWTIPMDPQTETPTGLPRRVSLHQGTQPFFSADGRSIIYFAQSRDTSSIVEIPSSGGPERVLYREAGFQMRWGDETADGRWIYFQDWPTNHYWSLRISRIPAGGGTRQTIIRHPVHYSGLSRDGRYLAYYPERQPFFARHPLLAITDLEGHEVARIGLPPGVRAEWGPGHTMTYLSYSTPEGIHAFDLRTGAMRVVTPATSGDTHPAYSPDGSTLATVRPVGGRFQLVLRPTNGDSARVVPTAAEPENASLHWSPDGAAVAFVTAETRARIDVVNVASGRETLLRVDMSIARFSPVVWRHDGRAILYVRDDGSRNPSVREVTLDGRDRAVRRIALPTPSTYDTWGVAFAGDSAIAVQVRGAIRWLPLTGGARTVATSSPWPVDGDIAVSPDGRWVAYTTPESAALDTKYRVTIASLAGGTPRTLPFASGCWNHLAWHPDSKHIAVNAYVSCDDDTPQIYLLPINGDAPRRLAASDQSRDFDDWSFSPDGETLAIECEQGGTRSTIMSADLSALLASAATSGGR